MYSMEQKRVAIEMCIRFEHSFTDTITELGYPSATMLGRWWREYEDAGIARNTGALKILFALVYLEMFSGAGVPGGIGGVGVATP